MDPLQSTLKPEEVTRVLIQQAVTKHRMRYDLVFFKAVLAGLMLSFGALMNEIVSSGTPSLSAATANPAIPKILGGFVFPSGFVLIPMLGLELLTSNMMVFPLGIAAGQIPWWSLLINWIIVTFGNLVGSLFSGDILLNFSNGILSSEPFFTGVQTFASKKAVDPEFHQIFLRGIGCNILVCIAIWLGTGARETVSKLVAIWIPIWVTNILISFVGRSTHLFSRRYLLPALLIMVFLVFSLQYALKSTSDVVYWSIFLFSPRLLGIMFDTPSLSTAYYIRKSLIATYLGNIVGAFIVWGPAAWFYIWSSEHDPSSQTLHDAEAGFILKDR
ncbi:hypothetical protein D9757_005786 [Collybiopsis confluens]|uniref:Formate/nitrite transporter n=1 Tax=Collybiopsis confluens TaxID=2823264 RepID=A0A8H5HQJ2_9AGAR|nr:hypothetical protein D9757_005786 [Collybiopsis confluens]